MPRTKSKTKAGYTTVQISRNSIKLIQDLIPGIYRSQSEFIHFWVNVGINELVNMKIKMKKLNIRLKTTKELDS
jgi:hypothetical protein